MDRNRAVGSLLVVVSACAFGSGALFAKPVYATGVDWHVLGAWRFAIAAALAWAWLALSADRRAGLRSIGRRAGLVAIALGVMYTTNSATYYAGLETVPASLAALIVYIYPAIVAVLTLRWGRRLEGPRAWLALGLALAGVALSVGGIPSGASPPAVALLLVVASPVIYAGWIVLSARLSGERRTGGRAARDDTDVAADTTDAGPAPGAAPAAATALMMSATATTYWVSGLALGREVAPWQVPAAAWPGLVGVGAVAGFIAIQTFYAGARRVGAAQAALISTVEPIWTIALAVLLLGESLSPLQLVGGVLIIGGVVLAQSQPTAIRRAATRLRVAAE